MPLLEPQVRRIAPETPEATVDRAPDHVAFGTPEPLLSDLTALLGADRLLTRALDLVAYASDASPYRLLPQVVVMARDAQDVAAVLSYGRSAGVPVTLRAGGTSLNGQAQGEGILVDVRRHFTGVEIEDDGDRVRVQPGTVLGRVNVRLVRHGRKLGPDPASTDIATVGGVIANNSGGMRCGVTHDSYRTVHSMTLVLPSGTVIDTAAPGAEELFAKREAELAQGLLGIRDEIRSDPELSERIRTKFEIKNTMGYRLIAFLDADTPLEIFRRLVVGSEGTLAFIAEAVLDTVPLHRHTSTAALIFPDIDTAVASVPPLVGIGATAVELMLTTTLKAAEMFVETPQVWKDAPFDAAAILVELAADDPGRVDELETAALELIREHPLVQPADFTRDREVTELFWRVREGMHGLVGRMRPPGTSLIIEDVCVRPERIAEAAKEVKDLLAKHGFLPGVAGHASAGNLHFMLTPTFTDAADRERYEAFMEELVELIVGKYDGSLKAEHGTGRNMAPFLEREWGAKATELMWRVKALADPDGVLAPGVLLNRDPGAHLSHLKSSPAIEEEVTACVECGFCEPVCPSRHLTTTPRQRIVVRREMARQPAGSPVMEALLDQYEYDALETCAADGSCRIACPLGIDTGKFVKELRAREHTERDEKVALGLAERWEGVERAARGGLRAGSVARRVLGDAPVRGVAEAIRGGVSHEVVPSWPQSMPHPAPAELPATEHRDAAAVYLPACVNRIFGHPRGERRRLSLPEALVAVSARAGLPLWIPDDVRGHCCATPWTSKGYTAGAGLMANRTVEALWRWTGEGALPAVLDASSCALGLAREVEPHLSEANRERHAGMTVLDSVDWAHDRLLPALDVTRRVASATVHPPCSVRHLGTPASSRRWRARSRRRW